MDNLYKLHKSLSTICIFAYWKYTQTNDLRYLIKDVDFDDMPEVEIDNKFYEASNILVKQLDNLDFTHQEAFILTIQDLIRYVGNRTKENEQICNVSFFKYLR